jgi:hypothetical protein
VKTDSRDRFLDIFRVLGGKENAQSFFSFLLQGRNGVSTNVLKAGTNNFEVKPSDLGLDSGIEDFQKAIFAAEPKPMEERKDKNPLEQTGTSFANITGPVKVVAEDGTIYDAKEGMNLQKGDQVWTGAGAKVELATEDRKNVVTVKENSAVSVDKNTSGQVSAPEDLLKIAFGQVSVVVSEGADRSHFSVQTPQGISGNRG